MVEWLPSAASTFTPPARRTISGPQWPARKTGVGPLDHARRAGGAARVRRRPPRFAVATSAHRRAPGRVSDSPSASATRCTSSQTPSIVVPESVTTTGPRPSCGEPLGQRTHVALAHGADVAERLGDAAGPARAPRCRSRRARRAGAHRRLPARAPPRRPRPRCVDGQGARRHARAACAPTAASRTRASRRRGGSSAPNTATISVPAGSSETTLTASARSSSRRRPNASHLAAGVIPAFAGMTFRGRVTASPSPRAPSFPPSHVCSTRVPRISLSGHAHEVAVEHDEVRVLAGA